MKLTVNELRKLIEEEYLRGVPEFVLHDLTSKYINGIKNHVHRNITMTQKSPEESRHAINVANETLKNLEEQVNQLLEDALWMYVQRT